jgi:hypothetical protein
MWSALEKVLSNVGPGPEASSRMSKCLADFDLRSCVASSERDYSFGSARLSA